MPEEKELEAKLEITQEEWKLIYRMLDMMPVKGREALTRMVTLMAKVEARLDDGALQRMQERG